MSAVFRLLLLASCSVGTSPSFLSEWEEELKKLLEGSSGSNTKEPQLATGASSSAPFSPTTTDKMSAVPERCRDAAFTDRPYARGLGGLGSKGPPVSEVDLPPRTKPVSHYYTTIPPNDGGKNHSDDDDDNDDGGGGGSSGGPSSAAAADNFKVDLDPDRTDHFAIPVQLCSSSRMAVLRASSGSGLVYLTNNQSSPVAFKECWWKVVVPEGLHVAARLRLVPETCAPGFELSWGYESFVNKDCYCLLRCSELPRTRLAFSAGNEMTFEMEFTERYARPTNVTMFYFLFDAVTRNGRLRLPAVMTSPTAGYVTSAGFGGDAGYSKCTLAAFDLTVPPGQVAMVSVARLDLVYGFPHKPGVLQGSIVEDRLELYDVRSGTTQRLVASVYGGADFRPRVFNASVTLRMVSEYNSQGFSGFKARFSFHPAADAPEVLDDGLLNCSGSSYAAFRQHVHCNLARDCAGGEDEGGHCPFSSERCNGSVASGTKCFAPFRNERPVTWEEASQACGVLGGNLAGLRTEEERKAVESIFNYSRSWSPAWVGLKRTGPSVPHMYWRMWQWRDGVLAYSAIIDYYSAEQFETLCAYLQPQFPGFVFAFPCTEPKFDQYFCEFEPARGEEEEGASERSASDAVIKLADIAKETSRELWRGRPATECPAGHVTMTFLSCDVASDCRAKKHRASCELARDPEVVTDRGQGEGEGRVIRAAAAAGSVAMFACDDGDITLPYTLVCDFLPHCPDAFDETFCNHGDRGCQDLACKSGQCFAFVQKCDMICDCLDCSDEDVCPPVRVGVFFSDLQMPPEPKGPIMVGFTQELRYIYPRLPPPSVIRFDRLGRYTQRAMAESDSCPVTHFRCSTEASHCLPVYVRCNGVSDCPRHEDEEGCGDRYACPGFYRCRKSRACLHADHVCDGWPQCPQHDDELYCGLSCPPGCLCHGLSFVCPVAFPAREYPDMRYLDASRSDVRPADLAGNAYLVWLKMASCGLALVSGLSWPNLIHLDLSHNDMAVVSMSTFLLGLPNLRTLILAGNPLVSLLGGAAAAKQEMLKSLDLSRTRLREFNSSTLSCCPYITALNMSHCRQLDRIGDTGFKSTPYLISLDLSGSPVSVFPATVFAGMNQLRNVFAANFKFCCRATLPEGFDENFCFAPQDEISSCDDLLRSNAFRGSLWTFAGLAFSGNLGCFLVRFFFMDKGRRSGFIVFVTNLTVADFLMGVYLVIVGVADGVYRGRYLWHETAWRTSRACAAAGFLSLLSSEMSAFIICLITLDRFIVLTFPFTSVRFRGRSAAVTCGLVWTLGLLLASVPFLPLTPRWEFYGQTGICIPLPITRSRFPGQGYAFGVMILLNFALFVLIAAGQASIFRSVRVNSMAGDSGRKSQDMVIARRLITVAASDFLCWFPIGLLGLLSSTGVPVSGQVSVAMAIFVLPLNSAMNPFLYTFNVVMENRRKAYEARLIKILEARILSQKS